MCSRNVLFISKLAFCSIVWSIAVSTLKWSILHFGNKKIIRDVVKEVCVLTVVANPLLVNTSKPVLPATAFTDD